MRYIVTSITFSLFMLSLQLMASAVPLEITKNGDENIFVEPHEDNNLQPIAMAQRNYHNNDRSHSDDDHGPEHDATGARIMYKLGLIVLSGVITAIVTLTLCCCPQVLPCEKFKNRGRGSCDWSTLCEPYWVRRMRQNQAPIIVTVNMPNQAHHQEATLIVNPPPLQPSPRHSRVGDQGAIYSSPSYPIQQQQPYNTNY